MGSAGSATTISTEFWRRAFLVYICFEGSFMIFSYLTYINNCVSCEESFMSFIGHTLLDISFTFLLWNVLNHFHTHKKMKLVMINLVAFPIYITLFVGIKYTIAKNAILNPPGLSDSDNLFREVAYNSWFDIGKYVFKITAFYVLRFYCDYRRSEEQKTELVLINKNLQLNLLKKQLSPHFYFNTLNNLYGLSRNNNPKLSQALTQLSNIMHYVINDCHQPKVLLAQEISFLQSYIALEKLRYEEDTVIDMRVEGAVNGQRILPLLLIQFVENAFKHGMKEKSDKNWMKVKIAISDYDLSFCVNNSYYDAKPVEGIGLASVKRHLNLLYEGKYDMKLAYEKDHFSLNLKLNLA